MHLMSTKIRPKPRTFCQKTMEASHFSPMQVAEYINRDRMKGGLLWDENQIHDISIKNLMQGWIEPR